VARYLKALGVVSSHNDHFDKRTTDVVWATRRSLKIQATERGVELDFYTSKKGHQVVSGLQGEETTVAELSELHSWDFNEVRDTCS